MSQADSPAHPIGQSSVDLLIVGGGIMGLWAAVHAERLGIRTLLIDAGTIGQGASGGLLGALMPHMPDRWSDKKQFQFDALVSLESEIAALEGETGMKAHYCRSGRLIPLPKPHLRTIASGHSGDAERHWQSGERRFSWHVLDAPPVTGWIDPSSGESGFVHDTLAARVAPRRLVAVLRAFLQRAHHVRIVESAGLVGLDPDRGRAETDAGPVAFGHCILAAGHHSFAFLNATMPEGTRPLGQPVKGQAALLKAEIDPSFPVIFRDGLYIVAHEEGLVAVGSTSENSFTDPFSTDERLEALIEAAHTIAPVLESAPVVERWAGLRPKAIDRDPMVGPHPRHPRLIALTGGFKVSFGLAHRLAAIAVDSVASQPATFPMPENFSLSHHMGVASRKT